MNGATPTPRFLAADKLGLTTPRLVHAADLFATIAEITGTESSLPPDLDSVSMWRFASRPGPRPPIRTFSFSQYFTNNVQRATIRNLGYKLNYEHPNQWSLFAYQGDEVPGLEDSTAVDVYPTALADVQAGVSNPAADNLNALLDELVVSGRYAIDAAGTAWVDPR